MVFILFSQVTLQEAKGGRHCEEKSHSISYDFCAVRIGGLEHNRSNDILWDFISLQCGPPVDYL